PQGARTLVANDGTLIAHGGSVLLTARAAADFVGGVINMDGVVQATSVGTKAGKIVLSGGDSGSVQVTGSLDASGRDNAETGGSVDVRGEDVLLFGGTKIDVSGDSGGGTVVIGGPSR